MNLKTIEWGRVVVLLAVGIAAFAATGLIGVSLGTIPEGRFMPEITLTILLVASIVAFVLIIIVSVAVFAALGLSDHSQAFGLPEGSVRAIIALCLLVVFSITSIYLYGRLRQPPGYTISGMTVDQANALPPEKVISKSPSQKDKSLLDVTVLYSNGSSDDFAKQVFSTLSTLVVAVAGFYFGSKTSGASKKTGERPTLNLLSPNSPAKLEMDPNTNQPKALAIVLETKPAGLAVEARINGSVNSAIRQVSYCEFRYEPTDMPNSDVTIAFYLAAYTDVRQSIVVKVA